MDDDTTVNNEEDNEEEVTPQTVPISRLNKEIARRKGLEDSIGELKDQMARFESHSNKSLEDKGDYNTLYEKSNLKNLELSELNTKLQDQLLKHTEKEMERREMLLDRLPDDLKEFGIDMEVDKLQGFVDKQNKFQMNMPRPDKDSARPTHYKSNLDWIKKDPAGFETARKEGRVTY